MSVSTPDVSTPRLVTVVGVSFVAAIVIACVVLQVWPSRTKVGIFGWNVAADGTTVISVTPVSPVADAGIRPGDQIDFASMPLLGRINTVLTQATYAGAPLTFTIVHQGQPRTVTLHAIPSAQVAAALPLVFASALLALIGVVLVLLRPSRMTWAFLLVGLFSVLSNAVLAVMNLDTYVVVAAVGFSSIGLFWSALLVFACRFPSGSALGLLRWLDASAVPLAVLYLALFAYALSILMVSPHPPAAWTILALEYIPAAVGVIALAAFVSAGIHAQGSARQRLIPVIATFTVWVSVTVIGGVVNDLYTSVNIIIMPVLAGVALTFFAFAVAYGVVRHRVIDVSFIISRTLVYTILISILVAAFALIDLFVGKLLERTKLALTLEILTALFMGVWLHAMHERVDRFVDSVLFRRRHLAEKRLARVAKALPHSPSVSFVDEALVAEPVEALDLASCALFRRDGDSQFKRYRACGWNDGSATSLEPNDNLVVHLEAELDMLRVTDVRWPRTDIPQGLQQPLLAVPIVIGHRLEAFALYGGHKGGEALDPDEIRTLRRLAEPAGAAYDHLRAESLRRELEDLRSQNANLMRNQAADANSLELLRHQMATIDELMQQAQQPGQNPPAPNS
ncbi:MAG TPA: hypothetical protein VEJ41_10455 [Candidatus Acidoferrales bacterium]|nr:hypothetical protein [Candidatus Acidoferrales bacterium]